MIKNKTVTIEIISDRAIYLQSLLPISLAVQQKIWRIAHKCHAFQLQEIIPGMNNLTLIFDPLVMSPTELKAKLIDYWHEELFVNYLEHNEKSEIIEIPVNYGGKEGPDLKFVADFHKISIAEVIRIHIANLYRVFFIGFMPGFAYLGGMNNKIATPRRDNPRLSIPAGSVGIGGSQTGIYPNVSPGGWQIIGNTEMKLFDPTRKEPSLLKPGDKLRFVVNEVSI